MHIFLAALISLSPFTGPGDTLRTDGYYIRVSELAATWDLLYFTADGIYTDTSGKGTPVVFESGALRADPGKKYSVIPDKEEFILQMHLKPLPNQEGDKFMQYRCHVENGDLVMTGWKENKGKWKKMKERYFFIPY
jgi:hypothetical protein